MRQLKSGSGKRKQCVQKFRPNAVARQTFKRCAATSQLQPFMQSAAFTIDSNQSVEKAIGRGKFTALPNSPFCLSLSRPHADL
jgi:hypothetical protein